MAIDLTISSLPANGGSAILDIEWRKNAGSAVSLASAVTGTYSIDAVPGDSIQIRSRNAIGYSGWSVAKSVPVGATQVLLNNSFTDGSVWDGTDATTDFDITGGNLVINDRGPDFTHGVYQDIVLLPNTDYTLTITFSAASAGVRVKMQDSALVQTDVPGLTPLTTPGTYSATFNSGIETNWRYILSTTAPGATATINEVSLTQT
jgi:hypothetical protein